MEYLRLYKTLKHITTLDDYRVGLCILNEEDVRKDADIYELNTTLKLFDQLASHILGYSTSENHTWLFPLTSEGEFQKPKKKNIHYYVIDGKGHKKSAGYYYQHHPDLLHAARQKLVQEIIAEIEGRIRDAR